MLAISIFIHLTLEFKPSRMMILWGSLHWVGSWNKLLLKSLPTPLYSVTVHSVYKLFMHIACLYISITQTACLLGVLLGLLIHSVDLENANNNENKLKGSRKINWYSCLEHSLCS